MHVLSSSDFTSKETAEKCNLKDWQLFLRLWPKGRDSDNPEHLSLFLYILAPIESRRKAQYQMSLMNAEDAECFTKRMTKNPKTHSQTQFLISFFVVLQKIKYICIHLRMNLAIHGTLTVRH